MVGRWIVRTPGGDHVLSVARGKVAPVAKDQVRRLWFFAEAALSHREPEAMAGASALHAELTGRGQDIWGDIDDLPRVGQDLERAFQSGLITVEPAPPMVVRVRQAMAPLDLAPAPAPPQQEQQSPVWFEVVLVDELGEGIGNVQMVFDHQNQSLAVPTGGDGRAHHDAVGSSFARASFASVATGGFARVRGARQRGAEDPQHPAARGAGSAAQWWDDDDDPTPAALDSAVRVVKELKKHFALTKLIGHRDIDGKTKCPGGELHKHLPTLRTRTGLP